MSGQVLATVLGEGIPRGVVSDHGVKDGEELTHAGDEGNLAGLAGSEELLVEGFDRRVMSSGAHCGHVECGSDVCPAAPYGTSSPMSATVSVQGSDAHKGGDLLTVEGTEFGKGAYEGEGGYGAYTGDIHEEVELALPEGVGVNEVVNLLVQVIEFLGEEVDVFMEAGKKRIEGTIEAKGLGGFHVDELPSASEEGLEMGCLRVWERAGVGPEGEGEAGDGVGIDGIGLGQSTGGASEVPDLPGIHYCSRYLMKATLQSQGPLEAAGGLHDNEGDIEVLGQLNDLSDTLSIVGMSGGLVLGEDVKVEELTTDVDAYDGVLTHVIPFLQVRVVDPGNCTGLDESGCGGPC